MRLRALAAAVATAFAMAAATAQATVVHCGDTLTKNTTFGNDLGCANGPVFSIGADGIVVDVNGHKLSFAPGGSGIELNGHDRTTIKNGSLSTPDFSTAGIEVSGEDNTISHMTVTGGRGDTNERTVFGIRLGDGARGTRIVSTRVTEWLYGIYARAGAADTTVSNDLLERNACVGLFFEAHPGPADGDVITHSIARNNEFYGFLTGGDLGSARDCNLAFFGGEGGESDVKLTDSVASGNGELGFAGSNVTVGSAGATAVVDHNVVTGGAHGFELFAQGPPGPDGPVVSRNRATGAEYGFILSGNGLTVNSNTAQRNLFDGFVVGGAGGATVTGNVAGNPTPLSTKEQSGNGGHGFDVLDSDGIHMSQNNANKNGLDGVLIDSDTTGADVRSAIAGRNGGHGIEIQTAAATIASSRATFNGGFGILATPGDTDGGGNVAYGNAAGQCQNVFCTP
jgi:hypothetical protein